MYSSKIEIMTKEKPSKKSHASVLFWHLAVKPSHNNNNDNPFVNN